METSYTCDFNFAVLDSLLFCKQSDRLTQVKTIKSALWDLRKGERVRFYGGQVLQSIREAISGTLTGDRFNNRGCYYTFDFI